LLPRGYGNAASAKSHLPCDPTHQHLRIAGPKNNGIQQQLAAAVADSFSFFLHSWRLLTVVVHELGKPWRLQIQGQEILEMRMAKSSKFAERIDHEFAGGKIANQAAQPQGFCTVYGGRLQQLGGIQGADVACVCAHL
jgi:hypothetical protein